MSEHHSHRTHRPPRRADRHPAGVAATQDRQGQAAVLARPRRHGRHPGGGLPGQRLGGGLRGGQAPAPGVLADRHRHRQGRRARARHPRRLRAGCDRPDGRPGVAGIPHRAQGARRRVPDGQPPPVAALQPAVGHPARARDDHQGDARLAGRQRLHPGGHADPDPVGGRGHHDAVQDRLPRRSRPSWRRPASSTTRRTSSRSARSTASAPPSAPRRARRAAISRNSGWWSRRSPSASWKSCWRSRSSSSATSCRRRCASARPS